MMKDTQPTARCFIGFAAGVLGWLVTALPCVGAPDEDGHWAFQPVRRVDPPSVRDTDWLRNPIDRFILARLEADGLRPAEPATREQLIRRVSLGLTGLPPALAEIEAFVRDDSPGAFERCVDRLLASPAYGERWARHWLDLARYAESDGFEHDALRPHAWRYRDYVIEAFNADTAYDRFIREQIAGDEFWPDDPVALTATAFHLLGPDMVDSADQVQRRLNTLNDATDTVASVFLGLTLGCARCHNHKFEPLTQRDYFAMQAFYAPAVFNRDLAIPTAAERAAHEAAMARYRPLAEATQMELEALEKPYRARLHADRLSRLSTDAQLAHQTPKEKRTPEQQGTVDETEPMLRFGEADLLKAMSADDRAEHAQLRKRLGSIPRPPPLPATMALQNKSGPPPVTFVLGRGDYNNPRETVRPSFPEILGGRSSSESEGPVEILGRSDAESHRTAPLRAVLADWLTSPANPLTARVMVNRVWQHHFGRGLVMTPSDFGTQGTQPTHPELLDWLASEFTARRWSVKSLHRLILTSAAYQQSSVPSPESIARDPGNRLFSRQNRVRLEGEVVRDSLLFVSGRLHRVMGGPSVSPPIPVDIIKTSKNWNASPEKADHARRSLYILARRNLRFPFLEVFDAPDSNLSCPERGRSTTAPQSLTLLNSEEVMLAATGMSERLMKEADSEGARIELAFRWTLGRPPTTTERALTHDFLEACVQRNAGSPRDGHSEAGAGEGEPREAWSELCRALFNLNAFIYVD